jgi:cellulose synthase/poly-beta-1,6-N-acetylglucosamine synthase-like glycosyltransferase
VRDWLVQLLVGFDWFVLGYYLTLNSTYLLLVGAAAATTVRALRRPEAPSHDDIFANPLTPPISVVMGAFNEEATILESTHAALGLRYPELEVVVVDDGSTDDTFGLLRAEFDLVRTFQMPENDVQTVGEVRSVHVPRGGEPLVVIRKVNGGRRADALNAGLNGARHPLICFVDADSILEHDALLHVAKPFVDDPGRVVATGGVIRAVNGSSVHRGRIADIRQPRQWLVRIQIIEYLRSFLVGRTGWSRFGGLLIISGAFGLYRRDLLVDIGGYDAASLGEDLDSVVALHRRQREEGADHRIVFVPEPVCWTEVPSTRAVLARQRQRWSHGLAQVLWKQRRMIGNPRYGRIGTVAMPYYVAFELLGPIVELLGVPAVLLGLALGVVSAEFALLFAAVALLYGVALSVAAMLVEEMSFRKYRRWRDLWIGIAAAVAENVGYRQLHSWWRLKGLVAAVRGSEAPWGEMPRIGFESGAINR